MCWFVNSLPLAQKRRAQKPWSQARWAIHWQIFLHLEKRVKYFRKDKLFKISLELKLRIGTLEFFTGPSYSYSRLYGNWLGSLDLLALWVCQVQIPCRGWTREQKRGLEVRNERMKRLSFRRGEQLGTTYTHTHKHTLPSGKPTMSTLQPSSTSTMVHKH